MAQNENIDVADAALDLTQIRKQREEDHRRTMRWPRPAQHDELTGLPDHRYLDVLADGNRFRLQPGRPVAYVKIDIDGLREINRRWGQLVGNAVIHGVGTIVSEDTDGKGVVLRTAGDEFLAILPDQNVEEAWIWSEALRLRIERLRYGAGGTDQVVTVSIGVVAVVADCVDPHIVDLADGAMELARGLGGNTVCTWDRVEIDSLLRQVARNDELDLESARREFLARCGYMLGPIQTRHVTMHCEQVSRLSRRIAATIDESGALASTVGAAGLLHDIGKCVIPERLLAKPATLSLPEWSLMGRHATIGAQMAETLGADDEVVACVRHHHDRYDASPQIAAGVPIGARVLCVADALVTMSTPRSYALTMAPPDAIAELTAESGRQFDPSVVAAVLRSGPRLLSRAA